MDYFFDTIVGEWDSGLSEMNESSLSTDMIETSVERACDFFHIDQPADIDAGSSTGVELGYMGTYSDDIQFYNRAQLESLGITGQDGLDLVMTHEGTHRVLQGMETGFDAYQEELCCDYMAGVRAGLNGMDVSLLESSLIDMPQGLEHPEGSLRVDAIEQGIAFAQSYMETHTLPPTFNECLEDFQGAHMHDVANLAHMRHEVLAEECTMEHYRHLMENEPGNEQANHNFQVSQERYLQALSEYNRQFEIVEHDGGESTGSMGRNEESEELSHHLDEGRYSPSFKGYTQSEINSKKAQADHDMREAQSDMRHRKEMADSKARMGEPHEYEDYQYKQAAHRYEEAKKEYDKWSRTKPNQ